MLLCLTLSQSLTLTTSISTSLWSDDDDDDGDGDEQPTNDEVDGSDDCWFPLVLLSEPRIDKGVCCCLILLLLLLLLLLIVAGNLWAIEQCNWYNSSALYSLPHSSHWYLGRWGLCSRFRCLFKWYGNWNDFGQCWHLNLLLFWLFTNTTDDVVGLLVGGGGVGGGMRGVEGEDETNATEECCRDFIICFINQSTVQSIINLCNNGLGWWIKLKKK